MPKNPLISISVIAIILGYLMVHLYAIETRQSQADAGGNPLVGMIERQEEDLVRLETTLEELRGRIEEEMSAQAEGIGTLNTLSQTLYASRYHAGLTPLEGPGLVLTLRDNTAGAELARKNHPERYNPDDYILHDRNLLYVLNDLKKARPDGISINDQRIVSTTNIRCVGTVILVNDRRLAPPYRIAVVGDPDRILGEVRRSGEIDYLVSRGFPVTYEPAEEILLPAFRGDHVPRYAELYVEPRPEADPDETAEPDAPASRPAPEPVPEDPPSAEIPLEEDDLLPEDEPGGEDPGETGPGEGAPPAEEPDEED